MLIEILLMKITLFNTGEFLGMNISHKCHNSVKSQTFRKVTVTLKYHNNNKILIYFVLKSFIFLFKKKKQTNPPAEKKKRLKK